MQCTLDIPALNGSTKTFCSVTAALNDSNKDNSESLSHGQSPGRDYIRLL